MSAAPSERRTDAQREANRMDMELYRLIGHATTRGWRDLALALTEARPLLRRRMHEQDRKETA
jgi:hypothetical protein